MAATLSLILVGGSLAGQRAWTPARGNTAEQLRPAPGEVSVEEALKACIVFLDRAGVRVSAKAPSVQRTLTREERGFLYHVNYGGDSCVSVDVRTGKVSSFANLLRQREQSHGGWRGPARRFNSAIGAQVFIRSLAKRLGVPSSYRLSDLQFYGDRDPNGVETHGAPSASASFQSVPFGYPLRDHWGEHYLKVDPVDGVLVEYTQRGGPTYTILSHEPKLRFGDAKAKAGPVVVIYSVGRYRPDEFEYRHPGSGPAPARPSTLAYVCANGQMGGLNDEPARKPQRLRLAWVLHYPRDEEVWIDAADGRLLGGSYRGKGGWQK